MRRWIFVCLLLLCSCSSNRPFVFTNTCQMGDLYMNGELTDQHGNRWNIGIVPGMSPMFESSKNGWTNAGEALKEYGNCEFWELCADLSQDSFVFAKNSFTDYLVQGIGDDFSEASNNISENIRETPFGWIPLIAGNALWGYVFKPTFRMATAPVGIGLGLTGSVALPVGNAVSPVPIAALYAAGDGVAFPALGMTTHQVVYLLAIPNREPSVEHDGNFGLSVIRWKNGKPNYFSDTKPDMEDEDEIISEANSDMDDEDKIVSETNSDMDDNDDKIVLENKNDEINLKRLQKIAREYIQLQKYSLLFEMDNDSEDLDLFIQVKSRLSPSSTITPEAKQYYLSGELEKYFSGIWQNMQGQLTTEQMEKSRDAQQAFFWFKTNVLPQIGFSENN